MFHLRGAFSTANLIAPTTIAAYVRIVVALGLIHLTPDQEQQASNAIVHLIASVQEIIADGELLLALIGFFRKDTPAKIIDTTAPVTITQPTEISTKGM